MDCLEVPETTARARIQGQRAVREEIGTLAISAVEIGTGGPRAAQQNPIGFIEGKTTPSVGAAPLLPSFRWPCVVAFLFWPRHRVKTPSLHPVPRIESADVAG